MRMMRECKCSTLLAGLLMPIVIVFGCTPQKPQGQQRQATVIQQPLSSKQPSPNKATPKQPLVDHFQKAVNLAQEAAGYAQSATNEKLWLRVANYWMEASKQMRLVSISHPRYEIARQKSTEYEKNAVIANQRAVAIASREKSQAETPPQSDSAPVSTTTSPSPESKIIQLKGDRIADYEPIAIVAVDIPSLLEMMNAIKNGDTKVFFNVIVNERGTLLPEGTRAKILDYQTVEGSRLIKIEILEGDLTGYSVWTHSFFVE